MSDRWNPKRVTVKTERAPVFVVPGESRGASSVVPMGKTWGMRVRGDVDKLAPQVYRCPVHGEFIIDLPMSEVRDVVLCRQQLGAVAAVALYQGTGQADSMCGHASPWAGSPCGIGHAAGEVMS